MATTLQVRAWCMCTHKLMYIAIYLFDEKNHIIAFGTYNVTYLHGLFSNLGQKVLHRCFCLYWCG